MNAAGGGWNPGQYHKFADHRRRPAVELLARVPSASLEFAFDLGCGSGEITRLIAERWPGAAVKGIDSSPDMLARARAGAVRAAGYEDALAGRVPHGRIDWVEADIETWTPPSPPGLLFANASLQWGERARDPVSTTHPLTRSGRRPGGADAPQPGVAIAHSHARGSRHGRSGGNADRSEAAAA